MMQHLRNPKNVKLVSLFVAAIFVLGCFALTLSQSPELENVRTAMQNEIATAQKDFEEKSKTMNDAEKQRYYKQLQERIGYKEKELMEPVLKNIELQIQKIADKKGLSVVVHKDTVVFGGVDITDEVVRAMQKG